MTYTVHDIFYSIQGEGANIGKSAVFVRFAGCNLWSGREEDRADAICRFCDTEFRKGRRYTLDELVAEITRHPTKLVVFTGGEPALQLDQPLVDRLHRRRGWTVAIETNGTRPIPPVQWVCVSPKAGTEIVVTDADELKLVYPQPGLTPETARCLVHATHLWLSPMDGPNLQQNMASAVEYAKRDLRWRVNIQAQKVWGIP
jgi:7-carboxy-7-deazaguanine synthase